MNDEKFYTELLSDKEILSDNLLKIHEAIKADLKEGNDISIQLEKANERIAELRDLNQKLFLKVTSPVTATNNEVSYKPKEQLFADLIKEGKI